VKLRDLADDFANEMEGPSQPTPFYRGTLAMIDTTLRTISLLPDSIATQMSMCRGLEETLEVVSERLRTLSDHGIRQRRERDTVGQLAELLSVLANGQPVELTPFRRIAEEVQAEVAACEPLRFLNGEPTRPAFFAACHGLTVARVAARVVMHDPVFRDRASDLLLAALLHDVGMATLSSDLLTSSEPLTDEQRRLIEGHCRLGAQVLTPLIPDQRWLVDAAEHHHERLDGTGYPDGLRENSIEPLTRLLAVCDVYAALCSPRVHRPARSSRTALADTLLMAENGLLDTRCAELLLPLSFYPVGSLVELAHGERGVVVATPTPGSVLDNSARPVVALLTDPQGQPLPRVRHLDLTRSGHRIVRSLSAEERRDLSQRFPEWV
jgi:hypothetical protein